MACAAAGVGIVLAAVLAASLADPTSAHAEIPVLGPAVKAIGGVGHAILHPLDTVVEGFVKILQAIFGGIEARLITGVINALLTIPNFDNGHVASVGEHDGGDRGRDALGGPFPVDPPVLPGGLDR